jgi:hypothetical protein
MGNSADGTDQSVNFLSGKAELLQQNTVELSLLCPRRMRERI